MIPSKIQSIFSVGRPVIFVGPPDCSISEWIREADAGWTVPPGDLDGLMQAMEQALDRALREQRGNNARAFAEKQFDRFTNCDRITKLLEQVVGKGQNAQPVNTDPAPGEHLSDPTSQ